MATTYLSKTQITGTSTRKFTISAWVKRSDLLGYAKGAIWSMGSDSSNFIELQFNDGDRLELRGKNAGSYVVRKATNRLFRDTSAWYHIVVGIDSDQVSGPDRNKIYINGVQYTTDWDTDTDATLNTDFKMNSSSEDARCGRDYMSGASDYFDGDMAHVHYIDGTQYAASDFGETDSTSGIWVPISAPSVTYGNNGGFYKFASGALGTDSSGNDNTMTVSGTMTPTKDNAMNNFCTLNPLSYAGALSDGNTTLITTATGHTAQGTVGMESGKFYWEIKVSDSSGTFGICENGMSPVGDLDDNYPNYVATNTGSTTWTVYNNPTSGGNSSTFTGTAVAATNIISMAYDADNGALYLGLNGVWQNSGDPTSGASATGAIVSSITTRFGGTFVPVQGCATSSSRTFNYNFGNGYFGTTAISSAGTVSTGDDSQFEYDVPTGFYGLNTNNLGSYS